MIEESFEKSQIERYRSMTAEKLRTELTYRLTAEPMEPGLVFLADGRISYPSQVHIAATVRATAAIHARCAELIRDELARR